jgi:sugar/nucleoside kinase (ribokinase family)
MLAGEPILTKAADKILGMGPDVVIIKKGESGSIMRNTKGESFILPAFPATEVKDPTGAGDSFAGGFMGYLAGAKDLSDATLRRAMVYGSVMGSFTVERFGLDRLLALRRSEIHARARHFAKLTQFKL